MISTDLAAKAKQRILTFRFTPEMTQEFKADDCFVAITYKATWAIAREVIEKTGTPYDTAGCEVESHREAEALAKRTAAPAD